MMRKLALSFLLGTASMAVAMDIDQVDTPLEMSIIGQCAYKNLPSYEIKELEQVYNDTYLKDDIFLDIRLLDTINHKDLHGRVPQKIAYKNISKAVEGGKTYLRLHGRVYTVICRQMMEGNHYCDTPFQEVASSLVYQAK